MAQNAPTAINLIWQAIQFGVGEAAAISSNVPGNDLATFWYKFAKDFYFGKQNTQSDRCFLPMFSQPYTYISDEKSFPLTFAIDAFALSARPVQKISLNTLTVTTPLPAWIEAIGLQQGQSVVVYDPGNIAGANNGELAELTQFQQRYLIPDLTIYKNRHVNPLILFIDKNIPPGRDPADQTQNSTNRVTVDIKFAEIQISPSKVELVPGAAQQFTALIPFHQDQTVEWDLLEKPNGGNINKVTGVYTAPMNTGRFHVIATSKVYPQIKGTAEVTVTASREKIWKFWFNIMGEYENDPPLDPQFRIRYFVIIAEEIKGTWSDRTFSGRYEVAHNHNH